MSLATATLPSTVCVRSDNGSGAQTMKTTATVRGRTSQGARRSVQGADRDTFDGFDLDGLVGFWRRRYRISLVWNIGRKLAAHGHDVQEGTIKNWTILRYRPNADNLLKIAVAFGPEALVAAYPDGAPAWLEAAADSERESILIAEKARLEAELAALRARLAPAGEKGGEGCGGPLG